MFRNQFHESLKVIQRTHSKSQILSTQLFDTNLFHDPMFIKNKD